MKKLINVKPNAKRQSLTEAADGSLVIYLTSPPVDGKANQELIKLLAKTYRVPKSAIAITRGHHARIKQVEWPD
ncbi:DUF167 domain-containing protein [Spirulina major CS-329]|jgi:uncharacterized protein (TIGR00251 family)|uniref:DUF167 domain-containing protein n=1 Tax=Spirulina TaxID=1154 RepID=UPI00232E5A30|nr:MULTISPECIES: DUF167 domain-containing protein [Spirulina]MDB9493315.1 DUF167 domain-containing protein [Spirulina subsalsa CS-330]MDB9504491.1 DUF167 domain-containing protein [Spirulina major CS-329]